MPAAIEKLVGVGVGLIGASFACWAVAGTVVLLGSVYTFGSRDIPAPQATLMKTIIEGVLAGALPWGLVLSGAGLAITALLCSVSPLAFAIGVYLPLGTMAAIFVGAQAIRMRLEELALVAEFPEYAAYAAATPRIVPLLLHRRKLGPIAIGRGR